MKAASPLAKAEGELSAARRAAGEAQAQLAQASARRKSAEFAVAQWLEKWPQLEGVEGRPTFLSSDGAVRADIGLPPPPSDEQLERLAQAVDEARVRLEQAEDEAGQARRSHEPARSGIVVQKARRIGGTLYAVGDEFDPDSVDWRKLRQLFELGIVRQSRIP